MEECHEQLCAHKLNNLDEMDQFHEWCNLTHLHMKK